MRRRLGKIKGDRNVTLFHSRDFSDVEDSPQGIHFIRQLISNAGVNAATEAQAAGLPLVFGRSHTIIRRQSNGNEDVLVTSPAESPFYVYYKKGTVLHARKK